mmetsp:Transcript_6849/g.10833  ORF Transcript_6849/g.10833 Transcript_6849/m.10833 type:complete len:366 (+) Transcript_6849:738-1835(+)
MEIAPEVAVRKLVAGDSKLIDWLLKRLRKGEFDENQLYSSEILSMILLSQDGKEAGKVVMEKGGLKKLIRCIAKYRKNDPNSLDEVEMVENVFGSICALLNGNKENQAAFAAADGLTLMVTMIRKKRYTQAAAMKVLNYAVSNNLKNCEKLIDISGLKAVFKAFMSRGKKTKKLRKELEESEEHVLSCIVQLFANLSDIRYLRLLNKFKENGYEKVERLVEVHEKYFSRVENAENAYLEEHPELQSERPSSEKYQVERYMRRIDNGLHSLQLCSVIIALVCSAGNTGILERMQQVLFQQDLSLQNVKETLEEYHANMDEEESKTSVKMKKIVKNLLGIMEQVITSANKPTEPKKSVESDKDAPSS